MERRSATIRLQIRCPYRLLHSHRRLLQDDRVLAQPIGGMVVREITRLGWRMLEAFPASGGKGSARCGDGAEGLSEGSRWGALCALVSFDCRTAHDSRGMLPTKGGRKSAALHWQHFS